MARRPAVGHYADFHTGSGVGGAVGSCLFDERLGSALRGSLVPSQRGAVTANLVTSPAQ